MFLLLISLTSNLFSTLIPEVSKIDLVLEVTILSLSHGPYPSPRNTKFPSLEVLRRQPPLLLILFIRGWLIWLVRLRDWRSAYMAIFEEPSTQAGASLLPLSPSWGTWVRREGLGSRSSASGRSLCVQYVQNYFWNSIWMAGEVLLSKPNLSTPRTNSEGADIRKLPQCPTQTMLSSLVLPTIQLIF